MKLPSLGGIGRRVRLKETCPVRRQVIRKCQQSHDITSNSTAKRKENPCHGIVLPPWAQRFLSLSTIPFAGLGAGVEAVHPQVVGAVDVPNLVKMGAALLGPREVRAAVEIKTRSRTGTVRTVIRPLSTFNRTRKWMAVRFSRIYEI